MFHWICPECGREIAPTVRECPACDGAEQAELVLAGVVEASARTLNVEASAHTLNVEAPTRTLNPAGSERTGSAATPTVHTISQDLASLDVSVSGAEHAANNSERGANNDELKSHDGNNGGLQLWTAFVEPGAASAGSEELEARLEAAAKIIAEAPQNPPIPEPERLLIPEIVDPANEMSRLVEARAAALFGARGQESRQTFRSIRTKTVESRLVDARSSDAKSLEGRSLETKPVETKLIETKLIHSGPIEDQPVEVKSQASETEAPETNSVEPVSSRETESAPRLGKLSRMLLAAGVDLYGKRSDRLAPPPASTGAAPDVGAQSPPEVVPPEAAAQPHAPAEEPSLPAPELASLETSFTTSLPTSSPPSLPTSSASLGALDVAVAESIPGNEGKGGTALPAAPDKPLAEEPEATAAAPVDVAIAESPVTESSSKELNSEESTSDGAATAAEDAPAAEIASPPDDPSVVPAAASLSEGSPAEENAAEPNAAVPNGAVSDPPLGGKLPLPGSPASTVPLSLAPAPPQNLAAEPATDPQALIDRAALATQSGKPLNGPALVQVQMRLKMPVVTSPADRPAGSVEHEAPEAPTNDAPQAPDTPVREPSPRMGRLVRYSPVAKRTIIPAAPDASPCASSVDFGVTVPGPVLTATLIRFRDPRLKPNFVELAALKKGFNYGLLILVILIGSGLGFLIANVTHFFQGTEAEAETAAAAAPETKPEPATPAATASNSLSKSMEVTGFRIVANPAGKTEVQYIVVNHSPVRFPDAKVFVTLYSTDARVGQPPVCQFSFVVPNLGPFEAKEMASNFETTQSTNLPEWHSLRANVSIGR